MTSFCKTNLAAMPAGQLLRWRHSPVRWTIASVPDEFDGDDYKAILTACWATWEAVCGLRMEYVESNANVICDTRRIDGQNGVLAEAELAPGQSNTTNQVRRMWFDVGENWASYQGGIQGGVMDIMRVGIHEFGHSLGIGHEESSQPAIMDPSVSSIRTLQTWDIQQAVARYGEKTAGPGPDGTPIEICLRQCGATQQIAKAASRSWELFKREAFR